MSKTNPQPKGTKQMAEFKWNWDHFWGTSGITVGGFAIIMGAFTFGNWWGHGAVLEGERLRAQNEIQFQLVTTNNSSPTQEMMNAAIKICEEETASEKDSCMKGFLGSFGQTWVVNLVDGSRTLLSIDATPLEPISGLESAPAGKEAQE
jgi:hypothetical protein